MVFFYQWAMGSFQSKYTELHEIVEYMEMKRQLVNLNDRLAILEMNYTNVTVRVNQIQKISDRNRDDIVAVNLMEEGRINMGR